MNHSDTAYVDFVRLLDLTGVSLVECVAKRQGSADLSRGMDTKFLLDSENRVVEREIDYRFAFTCEVTQDNSPVAEIAATYVTSFASPEEHGGDAELVRRFAQDVAVMAAYPYYREFVQSTAARLDLPGFTMGLVRRGDIVLDQPQPAQDEG